MSAFDVIAWLLHIAIVVLAWPWLRQPGQASRLSFWLSFVPIISWVWLIPKGVSMRLDQRAAQQARQRKVDHIKAVEFWRQQISNGTPVEQENARQILAMWGVPEQPSPVEAVNPVVVRTDRPGQVRQMGDYLVVGGVARAHLDPPSLELYRQGCRCPACVALVADARQVRRATGFDEALAVVRGQIVRNLSVPPATSAWSSVARCPACDVEEVHVTNGAGQTCVVYLIGRTCAAHGAAEVNLAVPADRMRR